MRRVVRLGTLLLVAATLLASTPLTARAADPVPGACAAGGLPHGALSLICTPASGWNGDLVIFAHGYIPIGAPLGFYDLTVGGVSLPDLVQRLGFAFATTSYRQNGLAIVEAQDDIRELVVAAYLFAPRPPARVFLVGGSEGGLVTTLLIERSPQLFAGAVAACGPIGGFRAQIDHIGDVRVLFDVLFPGVLPGSATSIPAELIAGWDATYLPRVRAALAANPIAATILIKMAGIAVDPNDPSTVAGSIVHLLWYNVLGTNDAAAKLGGNPFDNTLRHYSGSGDVGLDALIEALAARYSASPLALLAMTAYETSGSLTRPLVAPHTTGDEVIPFWQELLYARKLPVGAPFVLRPVARHGHCQFTPDELLGAFVDLLARVP